MTYCVTLSAVIVPVELVIAKKSPFLMVPVAELDCASKSSPVAPFWLERIATPEVLDSVVRLSSTTTTVADVTVATLKVPLLALFVAPVMNMKSPTAALVKTLSELVIVLPEKDTVLLPSLIRISDRR